MIGDDDDGHAFFEHAIERYNSRLQLVYTETGKMGIQMFRKIRPVVTFIKFQLNDMNGVECLRRIKAGRGVLNMPVYIYSSLQTIHLQRNAQQVGATGLLTEGIGENSLAACLYKTLTDESADDSFGKFNQQR